MFELQLLEKMLFQILSISKNFPCRIVGSFSSIQRIAETSIHLTLPRHLVNIDNWIFEVVKFSQLQMSRVEASWASRHPIFSCIQNIWEEEWWPPVETIHARHSLLGHKKTQPPSFLLSSGWPIFLEMGFTLVGFTVEDQMNVWRNSQNFHFPSKQTKVS